MVAYEAGHEGLLSAALIRLKLLNPGETAPPPFLRASGVAGESFVYFVYLKTSRDAHRARGLWLVVKFEKRPERADREWEAVVELRADADLPNNVLLPIDGNEPADQCIIFPAAQGESEFQTVTTLQDLLIHQLGSNPQNCSNALDLVLHSLKTAFHRRQPGMRASAVGSGPRTWSAWFSGVLTADSLAKIVATVATSSAAKQALQIVRAHRPAGTDASDTLMTLLSSPETIVKQGHSLAFDLHFSRVHGDMNMTNALLSLAPDQTPAADFIIDVPHSRPEQPTALDFARLEVDFFLTVLPALIADRDELLQFSARLRDYLDGRVVTPGPDSVLWRNCVTFMTRLRRSAERVLNDLGPADRFKYAMRDLGTCLFFYYLKALLWQSTASNDTLNQQAVLCACLSLEHLRDILASRYSGASQYHRQLWQVLDPDQLKLSDEQRNEVQALAESLAKLDTPATTEAMGPLLSAVVPEAAGTFSPDFIPAIQQKLLELLTVDRVMDQYTKSYSVIRRDPDGTLTLLKTTTYMPVNLTNRPIRLHPAIEYELHEARRTVLKHFSVVGIAPGTPSWKQPAQFTLGDQELRARESYRDNRTPVRTYAIDSEFVLPPHDPNNPRPFRVTFEEEISGKDMDGDHIVTDRVLNGVTVRFDPGTAGVFDFSAGDGQLEEVEPNREWRLKGVLLPEQKISVRWRHIAE
ncbi:hypothetical protein ACFPN2_33925 [Steroidobacter flavus]|uniref:Uncharacterized protein n=1 Tax=Steroidobacter flavus TaxID=1842136 RepID=A0ABV8T2Y7_9GAMM